MRPARAGLSRSTPLFRNTWGSLAVLGVVAIIAFGLPLLDHLVPAERPLPAGTVLVVGGGVSLLPPPGVRLDVTRTRSSADRGSALLVAGDVRIAVVVLPYRGKLDGAADRLRRKITRADRTRLTGADTPVRTTRGVAGVRGRYDSAGRTGEYAVFVAGHRSVEVTASGTETGLARLRPGLDATVSSVAFGSGR